MGSAKTLLDDLRGCGLTVRLTPAGLAVQPAPLLTQELRDRIKQAKALLIVALANEEAEIRGLLTVLCGADHPDFEGAVEAALASPAGHLEGLRASAAVEGVE